jgi:HAD superfamily hydrolase (TIGR01509 family)
MIPETERRPIRAVLFDFDGTLTVHGELDFAQIRREIGAPPDAHILRFIDSLPHAEADQARERLLQHERRAAAASRPQPGAERVVRSLRERGIGVGVLTRNTLASVREALANFAELSQEAFDLIITRESDAAPKPEPDGVLHAAQVWGLEAGQIALVGDFRDDISAGLEAGALTVHLDVGTPYPQDAPQPHARVRSMAELWELLEPLLVLRMGKLPPERLAAFFGDVPVTGPGIVAGPGTGMDTAVVQPGGDTLISVTSDPITFVADDTAAYLLTINVNDLVTTGATPKWLVLTALFPVGTPGYTIDRLRDHLGRSLRAEEIALVGGHTEITDAVRRPVLSATLMGECEPRRRKDPRMAEPGQAVLLTKSAGVEGTAILAQEAQSRLRSAGLTEETLEGAARFLDAIGVRPEAEIAARFSGVSAMHDVTEGGVATALRELAAAAGCELTVELDRIRIARETRTICEALRLDPLGLIGSGALLIVVSPDAEEQLTGALEAGGIEVARIATLGAVVSGSTAAGELTPELRAFSGGREVSLPRFGVDEMARYLE